MKQKKLLSLILSLVFMLCSVCSVEAAKYEYDAIGRLVKVDYGESKKVCYSYDAGGNIKKVESFADGTTTEQPTESTASEYVWNHSDDTNTDEFFDIKANNWSNAVSVNYGDLTLTKAVKMETSSAITFTAPKAGTLTLVTYSTNSNPSVILNGEKTAVSANGSTEIEIPSEGAYTITKDSTNTYLYYISFKYDAGASASEKIPYIWNYTDGTNTDDFYTVTANSWKNAVSVTYDGNTLTKAVKLESSSSIVFNAPGSGRLTLVTYSTNTAPKVKVNGESYSVSANGVTEISISEGGTYTLTKDTTNTYLYYVSFAAE